MLERVVLVVEDDQGVRESIAEVLEVGGYCVYTAIDGQDALEKLKKGLQPFWILLDLTMPRMNGLEFLEVFKSHECWKGIPITFISAERKVEKEFVINGTDYLSKPFDMAVLLKLAKKHCPSC